MSDINTLGINLGSQYSMLSKCKFDSKNNFITEVQFEPSGQRHFQSLIVYTPKQIEIGNVAESSIKIYFDDSSMCVPRYISLDNTEFFQKELPYHFINPFKGKCLSNSGNFNIKKSFSPVSSLNLNNELKFPIRDNVKTFENIYEDFFGEVIKMYKLKNSDLEKVTLSVPDYINFKQRNRIKKIMKNNRINEPIIINESTAISLYYYYTNHKNMFGRNKKNVENIIFVDFGYSKLSLILTEFKYDEFKIKNVQTDEFFGGRDFNKKIFDYIKMKESEKQRVIPLEDKKKVLRIYQAIEKMRKGLTVNENADILVENIYSGDQDIKYNFSRSDIFENILSDEIKKFEKLFKNFFESSNNSKLKINKIVYGGSLMLTPIFQKIIYDISKIELSKNLLIDECNSVGAALYSTYKYKLFPIKDFKSIKSLCPSRIQIDLGDGKKKTLISSKTELPYISSFQIKSENNNIEFKFFGIEDINNPFCIYSLDMNKIKIICNSDNIKLLNVFFEVNEGGIEPLHILCGKRKLEKRFFILKDNNNIKNCEENIGDEVIRINDFKEFGSQYIGSQNKTNIYDGLKKNNNNNEQRQRQLEYEEQQKKYKQQQEYEQQKKYQQQQEYEQQKKYKQQQKKKSTTTISIRI